MIYRTNKLRTKLEQLALVLVVALVSRTPLACRLRCRTCEILRLGVLKTFALKAFPLCMIHDRCSYLNIQNEQLGHQVMENACQFSFEASWHNNRTPPSNPRAQSKILCRSN